MDEDRVVDILFILGFIAVIVLKITGVITCSWLVLFSPIIVIFSLGVVLSLILAIMGLIMIKMKRR